MSHATASYPSMARMVAGSPWMPARISSNGVQSPRFRGDILHKVECPLFRPFFASFGFGIACPDS